MTARSFELHTCIGAGARQLGFFIPGTRRGGGLGQSAPSFVVEDFPIRVYLLVRSLRKPQNERN